MKQNTNGQARRGLSHAWGALALGLAGWIVQPAFGGAQVEGAPAGATALAARFESWRLEVATGVMTPDARAALDALAKEAKAAASEEGASEAVRNVWQQVEAERKAIAPKAAVASRPGAQVAPEEEVLNRSILASLKSGNSQFISRLGVRAVPALQALARATDGSPTPEGELDPLAQLFGVDQAAGMDTALELMASKSFLIKRATVAPLDRWIGKPWLVNPVGDRDWEFKNPDWQRVATLAFEEPALSPEVMRQTLRRFVELGLLPRELAEQATEARAFDAVLPVAPRSALWFYEKQLNHPEARTRGRMLRVLARTERYMPILSLVNDPDRDVRGDLARALLHIPVVGYLNPSDRSLAGTDATVILPPFDPPVFEVFRALATSADKDVSKVAWQSCFRRLRDYPDAPKLSAEQLRSLVPLAKTPYQLSSIAQYVPSVAESEQVSVMKAVIAEVAQRNFSDSERWDLKGTLHEVAAEKLTADPSKAYWEIVSFIGDTLEQPGELSHEISLFVLGSTGKVPAAPLVDWLDRYGKASNWRFGVIYHDRGYQLTDWAKALTQAQRGQAIKAYSRQYEAQELPRGNFQLLDVRHGTLVTDPRVLRDLLLDSTVSARTRYWAAEGLMTGHKGTVDQSLVESLADTLVRFGNDARAMALMNLFPSADFKNKVMRVMLEHPEAQDAMLLELGVGPDDMTFNAIAKRFPMDTWAGLGFKLQIWKCVEVMIERSDTKLHPMLETICFSDTKYTEWIASRISGARTEALFPLACRILESSGSGTSAWNNAVDAIAGYFTDGAAAVLLEAARKARTEQSRERVMSAVRQITEWRDAAAAWERGAGAEAKRAQAIAALVATLDDAKASLEARTASMRGLGLLGAVEELPRIIAALTAEEAEMQAAARAALKRLEE